MARHLAGKGVEEVTQQTVLVLVVALGAAVPGLTAIWLWKRREVHERSQFEVQAQLRRQLQEQIDAQQKTIRFLNKRVDELQESHAREFAETEILRQEIEDLRQEVSELWRGVPILIGQLQAADITPAWSPPTKASKRPASKRGEGQKIDAVALRQRITEQFNLEEIVDLAFQLRIEPDDLAGATKPEKSRPLVEYLKDRGRLHELEALVRSQRPKETSDYDDLLR